MTSGGDTIWDLVRQASETLPEPFSRGALVSWVSKRRPDVELTSISTHIQYAIAEAPNRDSHYLGTRPPLITRVDRGLYCRYRGTSSSSPAVAALPASPDAVAMKAAAPTDGVRVILVGCSKTKARSAMPAGELFRGPGFILARDYAVKSGGPWFVLSAKYGLLEPADVVGPYDLYLGSQPASYRAAWGEWVVAQLALRCQPRGLTVEVHAGEAYTSPLREPLRRIGALLLAPLQGMGRGERRGWPGYRSMEPSVGSPVHPGSIDALLQPGNTVSPAEFLVGGAAGREVSGLYTWWIDSDGASALSEGLGHHVPEGLLYAGKAGGHRTHAAPSSSTLWARIAGNHLRGNVRSSTFRKSLAALLARDGVSPSEEQLTAWMHQHLRVAVLPVPQDQVAAREDEIVERTNPPLNLAGADASEARSTLSRLRGLVSRRLPSTEAPDSATENGSSSSPAANQTQAFEDRIRSDLARIIASGYRPTIFQRMLSDHGAVETARRLLAAPHVSDGFQYLWQHGLLKHSVEAAVLHPDFSELFSDSEREVARLRLHGAGYTSI